MVTQFIRTTAPVVLGCTLLLLAAGDSNGAAVPVFSGGRMSTLGRLTHSRLKALRGGGEGALAHSTPLPLKETLGNKAGKVESGSETVTLKISITYGLDNGVIVATGPSEQFGYGKVQQAPKLQRKGGDKWELSVQVPLSQGVVEYQYVAVAKTERFEALIAPRSVSLKGLAPGAKVDVQDAFRSPKLATLATSCFSRAVFGRGLQEHNVKTQNQVAKMGDVVWGKGEEGGQSVRFVVYAPRMEAGHSIWVTGSVEGLGAWSSAKALPMVGVGSGLFVGQVGMKAGEGCEYKYLIVDKDGAVVCKEQGEARRIVTDSGINFVVRDEAFNYHTKVYKAAGVAVPVSGIKTKESTGIGEFLDLKMVVDWCVKTGLQLVQILPINDSGEDPSPYSASSSFALHPSYVRPAAVCAYYAKKLGVDMSGCTGWAGSLVEKLNKNWKIDHPKVLEEKRRIVDAIFDKVGKDKVMADEGMQQWLKEAESWVKVYAAFKVQLAKERTYNNKWWDCTTWNKRASDADAITRKGSEDWDHVCRVYFLQYHLHLQLLEAAKYAEQNGVAIKGDIPIGVTRCSSDVWAEPHLFKLDRNCGAPGDPEQNWGFPPYNWEAMHRDGCSWWRRRLMHMEQYFHAYRIDHVLGFFRMWEIPKHGGGGQYVPQGGLREAGLKNLRAIQTASNMMICGEDLGNVPPEVPPVLLELGILGLRVQRWCEGHTWKYDYLAVAASSCHDCSPCRLWWNEEWGNVEGWYNFFIGKGRPKEAPKPNGPAPHECPGGPPDWVSQHITKLHAESTSMWTINPIQDYLDMWEDLRSKNCKNDIINRPGQTENCWVWRCHQRMENLLAADKFNGFLKKILTDAKRGTTY